jgi:hypothetical protein
MISNPKATTGNRIWNIAIDMLLPMSSTISLSVVPTVDHAR